MAVLGGTVSTTYLLIVVASTAAKKIMSFMQPKKDETKPDSQEKPKGWGAKGKSLMGNMAKGGTGPIPMAVSQTFGFVWFIPAMLAMKFGGKAVKWIWGRAKPSVTRAGSRMISDPSASNIPESIKAAAIGQAAEAIDKEKDDLTYGKLSGLACDGFGTREILVDLMGIDGKEADRIIKVGEHLATVGKDKDTTLAAIRKAVQEQAKEENLDVELALARIIVDEELVKNEVPVTEIPAKAAEYGLSDTNIIFTLCGKDLADKLEGDLDPVKVGEGLRKVAEEIARRAGERAKAGEATLADVFDGFIFQQELDSSFDGAITSDTLRDKVADFALAKRASLEAMTKEETRTEEVPVMKDGRPVMGEDGKPKMEDKEKKVKVYNDDIPLKDIPIIAQEYYTTEDAILLQRMRPIATASTQQARKKDPKAPEVTALEIAAVVREVIDGVRANGNDGNITLAQVLDALYACNGDPKAALAQLMMSIVQDGAEPVTVTADGPEEYSTTVDTDSVGEVNYEDIETPDAGEADEATDQDLADLGFGPIDVAAPAYTDEAEPVSEISDETLERLAHIAQLADQRHADLLKRLEEIRREAAESTEDAEAVEELLAAIAAGLVTDEALSAIENNLARGEELDAILNRIEMMGGFDVFNALNDIRQMSGNERLGVADIMCKAEGGEDEAGDGDVQVATREEKTTPFAFVSEFHEVSADSTPHNIVIKSIDADINAFSIKDGTRICSGDGSSEFFNLDDDEILRWAMTHEDGDKIEITLITDKRKIKITRRGDEVEKIGIFRPVKFLSRAEIKKKIEEEKKKRELLMKALEEITGMSPEELAAVAAKQKKPKPAPQEKPLVRIEKKDGTFKLLGIPEGETREKELWDMGMTIDGISIDTETLPDGKLLKTTIRIPEGRGLAEKAFAVFGTDDVVSKITAVVRVDNKVLEVRQGGRGVFVEIPHAFDVNGVTANSNGIVLLSALFDDDSQALFFDIRSTSKRSPFDIRIGGSRTARYTIDKENHVRIYDGEDDSEIADIDPDNRTVVVMDADDKTKRLEATIPAGSKAKVFVSEEDKVLGVISIEIDQPIGKLNPTDDKVTLISPDGKKVTLTLSSARKQYGIGRIMLYPDGRAIFNLITQDGAFEIPVNPSDVGTVEGVEIDLLKIDDVSAANEKQVARGTLPQIGNVVPLGEIASVPEVNANNVQFSDARNLEIDKVISDELKKELVMAKPSSLNSAERLYLAMQERGLGPKHKFTISGRVVYASDTFKITQLDGRPGVVLYVVRDDGLVDMRLAYKSNSQNEWRVMSHLCRKSKDRVEELSWIGKGEDEIRMTLKIGMSRYLDDLTPVENSEAVSQALWIPVNVDKSANKYLAQAAYPQTAVFNKNEDKLFEDSLEPSGRAVLNDKDAPDYKKGVKSDTTKYNPTYGTDIRTVVVASENGDYLYQFHHDAEHDISWLGVVEFADGSANNYGVNNIAVNQGLVAEPGIDYPHQARNESGETGGLARNFNDTYCYNTKYTHNLPVVTGFRDFVGADEAETGATAEPAAPKAAAEPAAVLQDVDICAEDLIGTPVYEKFSEINRSEEIYNCNVDVDFASAEVTNADVSSQMGKGFGSLNRNDYVAVRFKITLKDNTTRYIVAIDKKHKIERVAGSIVRTKGEPGISLDMFEFFYVIDGNEDRLYFSDIALNPRELQGKGLMSDTFDRIVEGLARNFAGMKITTVAANFITAKWFARHFAGKFVDGVFEDPYVYRVVDDYEEVLDELESHNVFSREEVEHVKEADSPLEAYNRFGEIIAGKSGDAPPLQYLCDFIAQERLADIWPILPLAGVVPQLATRVLDDEETVTAEEPAAPQAAAEGALTIDNFLDDENARLSALGRLLHLQRMILSERDSSIVLMDGERETREAELANLRRAEEDGYLTVNWETGDVTLLPIPIECLPDELEHFGLDHGEGTLGNPDSGVPTYLKIPGSIVGVNTSKNADAKNYGVNAAKLAESRCVYFDIESLYYVDLKDLEYGYAFMVMGGIQRDALIDGYESESSNAGELIDDLRYLNALLNPSYVEADESVSDDLIERQKELNAKLEELKKGLPARASPPAAPKAAAESAAPQADVWEAAARPVKVEAAEQVEGFGLEDGEMLHMPHRYKDNLLPAFEVYRKTGNTQTIPGFGRCEELIDCSGKTQWADAEMLAQMEKDTALFDEEANYANLALKIGEAPNATNGQIQQASACIFGMGEEMQIGVKYEKGKYVYSVGSSIRKVVSKEYMIKAIGLENIVALEKQVAPQEAAAPQVGEPAESEEYGYVEGKPTLSEKQAALRALFEGDTNNPLRAHLAEENRLQGILSAETVLRIITGAAGNYIYDEGEENMRTGVENIVRLHLKHEGIEVPLEKIPDFVDACVEKATVVTAAFLLHDAFLAGAETKDEWKAIFRDNVAILYTDLGKAIVSGLADGNSNEEVASDVVKRLNKIKKGRDIGPEISDEMKTIVRRVVEECAAFVREPDAAPQQVVDELTDGQFEAPEALVDRPGETSDTMAQFWSEAEAARDDFVAEHRDRLAELQRELADEGVDLRDSSTLSTGVLGAIFDDETSRGNLVESLRGQVSKEDVDTFIGTGGMGIKDTDVKVQILMAIFNTAAVWKVGDDSYVRFTQLFYFGKRKCGKAKIKFVTKEEKREENFDGPGLYKIDKDGVPTIYIDYEEKDFANILAAFTHELGHFYFDYRNNERKDNTRMMVSEGVASHFAFTIFFETLGKISDKDGRYFEALAHGYALAKLRSQRQNYARGFLLCRTLYARLGRKKFRREIIPLLRNVIKQNAAPEGMSENEEVAPVIERARALSAAEGTSAVTSNETPVAPQVARVSTAVSPQELQDKIDTKERDLVVLGQRIDELKVEGARCKAGAKGRPYAEINEEYNLWMQAYKAREEELKKAKKKLARARKGGTVKGHFEGREDQVIEADLVILGGYADDAVAAVGQKDFKERVSIDEDGRVSVTDGVVTAGDKEIEIRVNNDIEGYAEWADGGREVRVNRDRINAALEGKGLTPEVMRAAVERIIIHDVAEAYAVQMGCRSDEEHDEAHTVALMAEALHPANSEAVRDTLRDVLAERDGRVFGARQLMTQAEKAFESAKKLEAKGNLLKADKLYRQAEKLARNDAVRIEAMLRQADIKLRSKGMVDHVIKKMGSMPGIGQELLVIGICFGLTQIPMILAAFGVPMIPVSFGVPIAIITSFILGKSRAEWFTGGGLAILSVFVAESQYAPYAWLVGTSIPLAIRAVKAGLRAIGVADMESKKAVPKKLGIFVGLAERLQLLNVARFVIKLLDKADEKLINTTNTHEALHVLKAAIGEYNNLTDRNDEVAREALRKLKPALPQYIRKFRNVKKAERYKMAIESQMDVLETLSGKARRASEEGERAYGDAVTMPAGVAMQPAYASVGMFSLAGMGELARRGAEEGAAKGVRQASEQAVWSMGEIALAAGVIAAVVLIISLVAWRIYSNRRAIKEEPLEANADMQTAAPEPVQRPFISNELDRPQVSKWKEAHANPEDRRIAGILADNLTHISQDEFEDALAESVDAFNGSIPADSSFAVFNIAGKGGSTKSNEWVYGLAREGSLPQPKLKLTCTPDNDMVSVATHIVNAGVDNVVLIDDASFSAQQLGDNINALKNQMAKTGHNITIHVITPFTTAFARTALQPYGVMLHTSKIIPSVYDIIKEACGDDIAKFNDTMRRLRRAYFLGDQNGQEIGLTYFAHKIPDYRSFLSVKDEYPIKSILEGFVLGEEGKPILTGVETITQDGNTVRRPVYETIRLASETPTPYSAGYGDLRMAWASFGGMFGVGGMMGKVARGTAEEGVVAEGTAEGIVEGVAEGAADIALDSVQTAGLSIGTLGGIVLVAAVIVTAFIIRWLASKRFGDGTQDKIDAYSTENGDPDELKAKIISSLESAREALERALNLTEDESLKKYLAANINMLESYSPQEARNDVFQTNLRNLLNYNLGSRTIPRCETLGQKDVEKEVIFAYACIKNAVETAEALTEPWRITDHIKIKPAVFNELEKAIEALQRAVDEEGSIGGKYSPLFQKWIDQLQEIRYCKDYKDTRHAIAGVKHLIGKFMRENYEGRRETIRYLDRAHKCLEEAYERIPSPEEVRINNILIYTAIAIIVAGIIGVIIFDVLDYIRGDVSLLRNPLPGMGLETGVFQESAMVFAAVAVAAIVAFLAWQAYRYLRRGRAEREGPTKARQRREAREYIKTLDISPSLRRHWRETARDVNEEHVRGIVDSGVTHDELNSLIEAVGEKEGALKGEAEDFMAVIGGRKPACFIGLAGDAPIDRSVLERLGLNAVTAPASSGRSGYDVIIYRESQVASLVEENPQIMGNALPDFRFTDADNLMQHLVDEGPARTNHVIGLFCGFNVVVVSDYVDAKGAVAEGINVTFVAEEFGVDLGPHAQFTVARTNEGVEGGMRAACQLKASENATREALKRLRRVSGTRRKVQVSPYQSPMSPEESERRWAQETISRNTREANSAIEEAKQDLRIAVEVQNTGDGSYKILLTRILARLETVSTKDKKTYNSRDESQVYHTWNNIDLHLRRLRESEDPLNRETYTHLERAHRNLAHARTACEEILEAQEKLADDVKPPIGGMMSEDALRKFAKDPQTSLQDLVEYVIRIGAYGQIGIINTCMRFTYNAFRHELTQQIIRTLERSEMRLRKGVEQAKMFEALAAYNVIIANMNEVRPLLRSGYERDEFDRLCRSIEGMEKALAAPEIDDDESGESRLCAREIERASDVTPRMMTDAAGEFLAEVGFLIRRTKGGRRGDSVHPNDLTDMSPRVEGLAQEYFAGIEDYRDRIVAIAISKAEEYLDLRGTPEPGRLVRAWRAIRKRLFIFAAATGIAVGGPVREVLAASRDVALDNAREAAWSIGVGEVAALVIGVAAAALIAIWLYSRFWREAGKEIEEDGYEPEKQSDPEKTEALRSTDIPLRFEDLVGSLASRETTVEDIVNYVVRTRAYHQINTISLELDLYSDFIAPEEFDLKLVWEIVDVLRDVKDVLEANKGVGCLFYVSPRIVSIQTELDPIKRLFARHNSPAKQTEFETLLTEIEEDPRIAELKNKVTTVRKEGEEAEESVSEEEISSLRNLSKMDLPHEELVEELARRLLSKISRKMGKKPNETIVSPDFLSEASIRENEKLSSLVEKFFNHGSELQDKGLQEEVRLRAVEIAREKYEKYTTEYTGLRRIVRDSVRGAARNAARAWRAIRKRLFIFAAATGIAVGGLTQTHGDVPLSGNLLPVKELQTQPFQIAQPLQITQPLQTLYAQAARGELREGHTVTVEFREHTYTITREVSRTVVTCGRDRVEVDTANLEEALRIALTEIGARDAEVEELNRATAQFGGKLRGTLPYEIARTKVKGEEARTSEKSKIIIRDGEIFSFSLDRIVRKSDAGRIEDLRHTHFTPYTEDGEEAAEEDVREYLGDMFAMVEEARFYGITTEEMAPMHVDIVEGDEITGVRRILIENGQFAVQEWNDISGKFVDKFDRISVAAITKQITPAVLEGRTVSTFSYDGVRLVGMFTPTAEPGVFEFAVEKTEPLSTRLEGMDDLMPVAPAPYRPVPQPAQAVVSLIPDEKTEDDIEKTLLAREIEETGILRTDSVLSIIEKAATLADGTCVLVFDEGAVDESVIELAAKDNRLVQVVVIGEREIPGAIKIAKSQADTTKGIIEYLETKGIKTAKIGIVRTGTEAELGEEVLSDIQAELNRNNLSVLAGYVLLNAESKDNAAINMANLAHGIIRERTCFLGVGYEDEAFTGIRNELLMLGGYFRVIASLSESLYEIYSAIHSTLTSM